MPNRTCSRCGTFKSILGGSNKTVGATRIFICKHCLSKGKERNQKPKREELRNESPHI